MSKCEIPDCECDPKYCPTQFDKKDEKDVVKQFDPKEIKEVEDKIVKSYN